MEIIPRFFKITSDDENIFNLIIVSPSPKFKGLIQISVFSKTSLSNGQSQNTYLPEFDVTLKLNQKQNIKYPNSSYGNLGMMVETTETSFKDWFSKYKNVLGCESNKIIELSEFEAFNLPITVFTDHNNYDYDEPLEPDVSQAIPILTDDQIN